MKAFLASLLASATMAAETMTWTGTKATGGDLGATPKGSSSWSGTANTMAVTWTTSVTLTNKMANDDYVQAWWCMPYNSKMDCNLWQWEMDGTNYVIKGKNYRKSTTTLPSPAETKPKAWFDKSANGFTAETAVEYKQTGDNKTPAKKTGESSSSNYKYASSKVNGKSLTGAFKRTYTAAQTDTIEASGVSAKGKIGVYANDKSKSKSAGKITSNVTIGIKKKKVVVPKTVNGVKKTWTGPSVTHEDNTVKAGGWTLWKKVGTDLDSWLCQTGTATVGLSDDDWTIQTYLWDKTAKTFKIWTFRNDIFKYYEVANSVTSFEQGKSPKKQLDNLNASPTAKIYFEKESTGWAIDSSQNLRPNNNLNLDTANTKVDAANKVFTGCMRTDSTESGKHKGSTKSYTQGVWYSEETDKDGKHVEKDVSVVVSAEGSATSILTTLGAVAATVAALAF